MLDSASVNSISSIPKQKIDFHARKTLVNSKVSSENFERKKLTLSSVPVKESLSAEHSSELLGHALEELLDGGGVSDEGGGHFKTAGRDVTDSGLDLNAKFDKSSLT